MAAEIPAEGLQLLSLVRAENMLELFLDTVAVAEPGPNEVLIRVEATPVNPSDLGLLLAGADISAASAAGTPQRPVITAPIPDAAMRGLTARIGTPMPAGNEGAGTVVAAGSSEAAQRMLGKKVAAAGGAMYSEYRTVDLSPVPGTARGSVGRRGSLRVREPDDGARHDRDHAARRSCRAGAHRSRFQPRPDAAPALPAGAGPVGQYCPQAGAGGTAAGGGGRVRLRLQRARVH